MCDNPQKCGNGLDCIGEAFEGNSVDGGWSEWSEWSDYNGCDSRYGMKYMCKRRFQKSYFSYSIMQSKSSFDWSFTLNPIDMFYQKRIYVNIYIFLPDHECVTILTNVEMDWNALESQVK